MCRPLSLALSAICKKITLQVRDNMIDMSLYIITRVGNRVLLFIQQQHAGYYYW